MTDNMIKWEKDADGVVILTMDDPNQGANTMNDLYTTSMAATVDRLEAEKDDITGVILTSAKKTFFAGGDLKDMTAERTESKEAIAAAITERTNGMKAVLRRLETLGKPVVVMREKTERSEGVAAGTAVLVGTDEALIIETVSRLLAEDDAYTAMARAVNPYGDGQASDRICRRLSIAGQGT